RSQPAAIWERPALWTQTNRTLGQSDIGLPSLAGTDGQVRFGRGLLLIGGGAPVAHRRIGGLLPLVGMARHRLVRAAGRSAPAGTSMSEPSGLALVGGTTTSPAACPTCGYSTASRPIATSRPTSCAATKPGTEPRAIPAKVSVNARPI